MSASKKIILILSYFILPIALLCQPQEVLEIKNIKEMSSNIESIVHKLKSFSSPLTIDNNQSKGVYLEKEWSPAIIYTKNKEFLNCAARYNIHKNRMEVRVEDEIRVLQKKAFNGIIINEDLFINVSSGESEDGKKLNYFQVLAEGQLTLLKKHTLSQYTTGGTALYQNIGTGTEYRANSELYYCHAGEEAYRLKKGKKNISKILNIGQDNIKSIAEVKDLGFKKEEDLVALFDWYNRTNDN